MDFPNKEEAVRFFTDVKLAVETFPESFTDPGLVFRFSDNMLEGISGKWKTLELVPEPYYEINQEGIIRHKVTREVIKPTYQVDQGRELVKIRMSGESYYFYGPKVAENLFNV